MENSERAIVRGRKKNKTKQRKQVNTESDERRAVQRIRLQLSSDKASS